MVQAIHIPAEIIKKIGEIFPYYLKNLKEDSYLINLWEGLFNNLNEFFKEKNEIFFSIDKDSFSFQNEKIHIPPSLLNFHSNLYNEGIRLILIKKDITKEEISKFLSIFNIPFSKMSYKDQSLKIFIQRENFKNIEVFCVEDEIKESSEKFIAFFELSKNFHNEHFELSKEKKEFILDLEDKEFQIEAISEPVKKSLKFTFEETIMEILSQYEKETNLDYKVLLLQALRYLYQETISSAEFKKINFILRNLKLKDDKSLNDLFTEFQEEENLTSLIRATQTIDTLKPEEFIYFQENLNSKSQKKLILKIFEENILKHREEIYTILKDRIENNRELFLEIYNEIDKNKIQNFFFLLQKLPEDFIKEEELLSHKNLYVKGYALKVCRKVSDKNLLEFLDSENLELKLQTLSYIERFKKEIFVPILISRIKKENFYEKEKEEKEKYFEVLSKIKNIEAINFLKEILSEHKLFSSQKRDELRAMAAIALARTKDPKFKEMLIRESKSIANSNLVKDACKRASEIIEQKEKK